MFMHAHALDPFSQFDIPSLLAPFMPGTMTVSSETGFLTHYLCCIILATELSSQRVD